MVAAATAVAVVQLITSDQTAPKQGSQDWNWGLWFHTTLLHSQMVTSSPMCTK